MDVAGGLYRELCDVPFWDVTLGSGGRAASAIIGLSPKSSLHTYASSFDDQAVQSLQTEGIHLYIKPRPTNVVFAYFHPLSRPHIQPVLASIEKLPPIQVSGESVLRFGYLEGSAVVNAGRAVYDPQTWKNPEQFSENGSSAQELAIVLNESELYHATGIEDLKCSATYLMDSQGAVVVVVKRGIHGAIVYEKTGKMSYIPAYYSSEVFKIGTGDVFSAIFSLYWAERRKAAAEAADLASRFVSLYCEKKKFNFEPADINFRKPAKSSSRCLVQLEGAIDSLGQRYVMEESRFILHDLGVKVKCPQLDINLPLAQPHAVLVIDDGLSKETESRIHNFISQKVPTIVLQERPYAPARWDLNVQVTSDFTTAMYLAAWAKSGGWN